ncbi:Hypothetical protein POVN_LOCUS48 [uncultured virus]|nr:Hypothetical protein POVN_LOCUS48 [uncultured virus]
MGTTGSTPYTISGLNTGCQDLEITFSEGGKSITIKNDEVVSGLDFSNFLKTGPGSYVYRSTGGYPGPVMTINGPYLSKPLVYHDLVPGTYYFRLLAPHGEQPICSNFEVTMIDPTTGQTVIVQPTVAGAAVLGEETDSAVTSSWWLWLIVLILIIVFVVIVAHLHRQSYLVVPVVSTVPVAV